jgi:GNAT superfamily N-acetyltransferase
VADIPPGWETDLAVLQLSGSVAEDRGDHLVVRSPHNPDFHWGNFVFVTDPGAVGDVGRWVETFRAAFPEAAWTAIGLTRMPDNADDWAGYGLDLELDDVLTTRELPPQTAVPQGYRSGRLTGGDWTQMVALDIAENDRTDEYDPQSFGVFAQAQMRARRELSDRGAGAFFGAFAGEALVADLGIVRCGTTARYQSVGTAAAHRRRGLASHLLGVAARWAADHGCRRWVIITEADNPAGRVYRSLGFRPDIGNAQAYRKPAR